MFLGLSLTTWWILLGIFVVITPIVGKQIAKDALRIKNALSTGEYELTPFVLFPEDTLGGGAVHLKAPIQMLTEEQYISRMMWGGVWMKFLSNLAFATLVFTLVVIGFIIYAVRAFFRGIFSTE